LASNGALRKTRRARMNPKIRAAAYCANAAVIPFSFAALDIFPATSHVARPL
jgi:hypothetical protein